MAQRYPEEVKDQAESILNLGILNNSFALRIAEAHSEIEYIIYHAE